MFGSTLAQPASTAAPSTSVPPISINLSQPKPADTGFLKQPDTTKPASGLFAAQPATDSSTAPSAFQPKAAEPAKPDQPSPFANTTAVTRTPEEAKDANVATAP